MAGGARHRDFRMSAGSHTAELSFARVDRLADRAVCHQDDVASPRSAGLVTTKWPILTIPGMVVGAQIGVHDDGEANPPIPGSVVSSHSGRRARGQREDASGPGHP